MGKTSYFRAKLVNITRQMALNDFFEVFPATSMSFDQHLLFSINSMLVSVSYIQCRIIFVDFNLVVGWYDLVMRF